MHKPESQKQFFSDKGYLIVPNVLSTEEVAFMRKRILGIFETGEWKKSAYNTDRVLSDVYNYFPEFIEITLNKKVLQAITNLLGKDPVLMPETAIHYQFYTGWHKDTTTQEQQNLMFHHRPESLMLEAGFYLQDNDEWGGGLTVMEGSHKVPDPFVSGAHYTKTFFERIKNKILNIDDDHRKKINPYNLSVVDIPSKAGDLVIFNLKTNHRATVPVKRDISQLPEQKKKIAFFNAFSVNNDTAKSYFEYICARKEPFYQNLKSRKQLHEDLVKHALNNGYQIF